MRAATSNSTVGSLQEPWPANGSQNMTNINLQDNFSALSQRRGWCWLLASTALLVAFAAPLGISQEPATPTQAVADGSETQRASAILAGGCFWCVETDFEKLPGVLEVVSGYTGGRSENPTYENYKSGGHREAVFVMYDPTKVTYAGRLV